MESQLVNPEIPDKANYRQVYLDIMRALEQVPEAQILVYRKLQMKFSVPSFD